MPSLEFRVFNKTRWLWENFFSACLEPDDGGLRAAVDEAVEPEGVPLQLVDRPRPRVHRRPTNHHGRAVAAARVEGRREVLAQRA